MPTLRESYVAAAALLGSDPLLREQAALDARTLLVHALRVSALTLYTDPDRVLTPNEVGRFEALLARRLGMEPVQYIVGEQEFYGLALRVTPATLIPRPETELLVEAVVGQLPRGREISVVDVGTGSGAIAIALAREVAEARVVAVDISEAALDVARENAARHGVGGRVSFAVSDLLSGVFGPFDAVVSNPPYVPDADRAGMHPQVREYEPAGALFAGADGLEVYRRLIPEAFGALRPGGLLGLEFGYGQAGAIAGLLGGWDEVEVLEDLQGIPRVALARRA